MPNTTEIVVRYAETDCMGVVHHAVYPVWFEMARTDYIEAIGMSYADIEKQGIMLPVTAVTCRYFKPAKYPDHLKVNVRITRLSPARIEFAYTVTPFDSGEILTSGTSSHAFVDSKTFKPMNFKKAMPDFFEKTEQQAALDNE